MKILLTGGGTGGHFYPIIAVAEAINKLQDEEKVLRTELFFMSTDPYDPDVLFENGIKFIRVKTGKKRLTLSPRIVIDFVQTFFGVIKGLIEVYKIFPDVIFSKGGYAAFPALVAARLFKIPVIMHESDSYPGRVNKWSGKFAKRVAISYPEASAYFPKEKTAYTGQPVRDIVKKSVHSGAFEYLDLDPTVPVLFILGGSQGAKFINDAVLEGLPELVKHFQIIHQVGEKNIEEVKQIAGIALRASSYENRYKQFGFLNALAMRMAAGSASLIVSRAGSVIFEIASWGVPSIIVPITNSNGDHQRKNAFIYARKGGCIVVEEENFTYHVLINTIEDILNNENKVKNMKQAASEFFHDGAAEKIAKEIMVLALQHADI